jgi:hypothetical protein
MLDIESGEGLDRIADRKVAAPRVHLNGTSKESLMKDYRAAWEALDNAQKIIAPTSPHMRDYYVQENGAEAFDRVRADHAARLTALEKMKGEYEALWAAVFEQD